MSLKRFTFLLHSCAFLALLVIFNVKSSFAESNPTKIPVPTSLVNITRPDHFPLGTLNVVIPKVRGIRSDVLKNIAPLIQKSIIAGHYPGAVIVASHQGHLIYRGVFGNRSIIPNITPMTFDTIFDIASLTKVVATTPAIMQLVERGLINLDETVGHYWPAFGVNGKQDITIRELMTHTSGMAADPMYLKNVLQEIAESKPRHKPGTVFLYSDINFVILAHLVELITGERFDQYCQQNIFHPLGMTETLFLPPENMKNRIAPTEVINDQLRWGQPQDPVAFALQGIAGNAGLFSTASNLAMYAECFTNQGRIRKSENYLLGPLTILKMTTPQTPSPVLGSRGLGWDIDSVFTSRGLLFSIHSFGHTGYTGTSIWIDPDTKTWIIILTSRTHPKAAAINELVDDRRAIANIIAASITDVNINGKSNTGRGEIHRAYNQP